MIGNLRSFWSFLSEVFYEFSEDNCFRLAAALSYYTLFSIAPLVIVVIATAGYFFGEQAISGVIFKKAYSIIGAQAASGLQAMVQNAYIGKPNSLSGLVSIGVLIFSATIVLTALQSSLNTIWKVRIKSDKGLIYFLISRLLALALLLVMGVLLIGVLVLHTIWVAIGTYLQQFISEYTVYLIHSGDVVLNLLTTTLIFALIFKYLPDAKVSWRSVWIGALTTSGLFLIGQYLISFYLGKTNITSLYGAAGSIVLLIVWINYSCWIFFFGAEVVMVAARRFGDKVVPGRIAECYRHVVE